jgi:hypothetical protein
MKADYVVVVVACAIMSFPILDDTEHLLFVYPKCVKDKQQLFHDCYAAQKQHCNYDNCKDGDGTWNYLCLGEVICPQPSHEQRMEACAEQHKVLEGAERECKILLDQRFRSVWAIKLAVAVWSVIVGIRMIKRA